MCESDFLHAFDLFPLCVFNTAVAPEVIALPIISIGGESVSGKNWRLVADKPVEFKK